jgi:hypothetical protein
MKPPLTIADVVTVRKIDAFGMNGRDAHPPTDGNVEDCEIAILSVECVLITDSTGGDMQQYTIEPTLFADPGVYTERPEFLTKVEKLPELVNGEEATWLFAALVLDGPHKGEKFEFADYELYL